MQQIKGRYITLLESYPPNFCMMNPATIGANNAVKTIIITKPNKRNFLSLISKAFSKKSFTQNCKPDNIKKMEIMANVI